MVNRLKGAKSALQLLWLDRCTIIVSEPYVDARGADAFRDKILHQDIPCKLSFFNDRNKDGAAQLSGAAAPVEHLAKIILDPEIDVPEGSCITVVRDGETLRYTASGPARRYFSHQEILLKGEKTWA